ncbi:MAG: SAM-dependent methyltransferase [Fuerstiella sp.]
MSSDAKQLYQQLEESVLGGSLLKAVLSRPGGGSDDTPTRIDVRPVVIRQQSLFQFSSRVGNQEVHRNLTPVETVQELRSKVGPLFRDCRLMTRDSEWVARFSRRGKCSLKKSTRDAAPSDLPVQHNRPRQYLIPEHEVVPFLVATGVMSAGGKVKSKQYSKFRQINRYVEFIRDIVPRLPSSGELRVVDFGSGKSYLTFAVHYYLTQVLHRRVRITGLDRREDVIQTCRSIRQDLHLDGIEFVVGDIAAYQPDQHVHLAISLHACDTATDDALAVAVSWKTDVILAVPCCQHELAAAWPKSEQPVISGHGILHERFAALSTDAVRACLLECAGYSTSVVEFIDMEHTARNLLIRSVRRADQGESSINRAYWQKLQVFCRDFGLPMLRLQKKLEEYGLLSPDSFPGQ